MDKKIKNDWEKFSNPKEIKRSLIDASLFLSFYEILKNAIVERISDFFNMEYKDGKFIVSEKYKKEIINRNGCKSDVFISSCLWLIDNEVISEDEFSQIIKIKEFRNRIAHDLPKFLFDSEYSIDNDLFNQIKILTLKIEKWWIMEVELTTNPDLVGQEIDVESIVPGQELILSYIFNIANTDLEELDKLFNSTINQDNGENNLA